MEGAELFEKFLVVEKRGLSSTSKALNSAMREVSPLDSFKLTADIAFMSAFCFVIGVFSYGIPAQFHSALLLWSS